VPAVTDIRTLFCAAIDAAMPLLAEPALKERFEEPSALPEFSVRGLAGHLLRAMTSVEGYVDRPEPEGGDVVSAAEYYAGILEPTPDINSELNRSVRQRGLDSAPESAEEFPALWAETVARLRARLTEESPDRLVQVYGDLVLTLDDYVVTRLIELVVHADDLATSLAVEPPSLPDAAGAVAISTLVEVARIRHGDVAILRALTRRERDAVDALRVI
jgi:uncharacterized protein (TIGR03083 family)